MKTWHGLDLFKVIAAILIVYMHTYNGEWGIAGDWIKEVLSTACVPFFFMVSGFLFRMGLERNYEKYGLAGERIWFRNYLSRLVKMYLVWSIITIPVAIMIVDRGHPEYGLAMKVLYHLRLFFLTGSIGIYWYVLAVILSAVIIRFFYKRNNIVLLWIVSSLLFVWGCLYNSPINRQQPWFEILHIVFGSERNFMNVGLFYMLSGFLFPARIVNDISGKKVGGVIFIVLLVSVLLRSFEFMTIRTNFTQALVAFSLFVAASSFEFSCFRSFSLGLRKLSVGIYMLHFPFILLFDFYLAKSTLLDFLITLVFSIGMFFVLTAILPHYSSVLFGYPSNRTTVELIMQSK